MPVDVFDKEWKRIYDSVFTGRLVADRPFRRETWEVFFFPYGIYMEEDIFMSIGSAARQRGDDELVIWNAEVLIPEPGMIIPWRYQSLDQARCTVLGHFETHLFGRSASWGVVCSIHDFASLGCEPSVMEAVASTLGGRDAIRQTFLSYADKYAKEGWTIPDSVLKRIMQEVTGKPT